MDTPTRDMDDITGDLADLACEIATERTPTDADLSRLAALLDELRAATVPDAEIRCGCGGRLVPGLSGGDPTRPVLYCNARCGEVRSCD